MTQCAVSVAVGRDDRGGLILEGCVLEASVNITSACIHEHFETVETCEHHRETSQRGTWRCDACWHSPDPHLCPVQVVLCV